MSGTLITVWKSGIRPEICRLILLVTAESVDYQAGMADKKNSVPICCDIEVNHA